MRISDLLGMFRLGSKKKGGVGDVLSDGKIDANDAITAGKDMLDSNQDGNLDAKDLDVNQDGKTDMADVDAAKSKFGAK